MSSPVSHTAAPVSLTSFAKVVSLSSKGTLVYLSFVGTTEGHAIVLKLEGGGEGGMEGVSAHNVCLPDIEHNLIILHLCALSEG